MTAEIIPLFGTPDPIRVEVSSLGTQKGRPFYVVDYAEADGGQSCMWDGFGFVEAMEAASHCADGGMPIVGLVGTEQARL